MRSRDEQRRLYEAEIALRDAKLFRNFMKAHNLNPVIESVVCEGRESSKKLWPSTGDTFKELGISTHNVVSVMHMIENSQ